MKNVSVLVFCFCLIFCNLLYAQETDARMALLERSIEPQDLEGNLSGYSDVLYLIHSTVTIKGRFMYVSSGTEMTEYSREFFGSGFAIDPFGRLVTNAHVVSPYALLLSTLEHVEPCADAEGGILDEGSVEQVTLKYQITDSSGQTFATTYLLEAKKHRSFLPSVVPSFIRIESITKEFPSEEGIELFVLDSSADLALITIPVSYCKFIDFGRLSDMEVGSEVYNFSWKIGSIMTPDAEVEVKQGFLESACGWYKIGADKVGGYHMLSKYFLQSEPGKSGSPIVDSQTGLLVGVLQSTNQDSSVTFAVPVDYLRELYVYANAIQDGIEKPKLSCKLCEE